LKKFFLTLAVLLAALPAQAQWPVPITNGVVVVRANVSGHDYFRILLDQDVTNFSITSSNPGGSHTNTVTALFVQDAHGNRTVTGVADNIVNPENIMLALKPQPSASTIVKFLWDAPNGRWIALNLGPTSVLVYEGTTALGTSPISSGGCAPVVTVTAPGVTVTDVARISSNVALGDVTGYADLNIYAYASVGHLNFKVCNSTGGGITPGALTLNWEVDR
jgi:hypothetical protein